MVGAKHMLLHSGFIPKTYPPNEWHENSVRFWTDLLAQLPPGLQVHVENVYEDDFRPLRDLVDAVADERFSICLDVGHVCANSTYSTAKWIDGLGERIRHVHLHNNRGKLDEHRRLTDGKITMKSTLRLLLQAWPKATWIVEMGSSEAEASLDWLQGQGYLAPKTSP
jgi:sugar phosphate isomerase/epimerase